MTQRRECLKFLCQGNPEINAVSRILQLIVKGVHFLQSDHLAAEAIQRAVDNAHTAVPNFRNDLVSAADDLEQRLGVLHDVSYSRCGERINLTQLFNDCNLLSGCGYHQLPLNYIHIGLIANSASQITLALIEAT